MNPLPAKKSKRRALQHPRVPLPTKPPRPPKARCACGTTLLFWHPDWVCPDCTRIGLTD